MKLWMGMVAVLVCTSIDEARADTSSAAGLRGLKEFSVLVEPLDPGEEGNGFTTEALRTDVEIRLRKAGIKIVKDRPLVPAIYVNVNVQSVEAVPNLRAYSIMIEVRVRVQVVETKVRAVGSVWSMGGVGTVGRDRVREIRESVADNVDQLINDLLSVK